MPSGALVPMLVSFGASYLGWRGPFDVSGPEPDPGPSRTQPDPTKTQQDLRFRTPETQQNPAGPNRAFRTRNVKGAPGRGSVSF